MLTRLDQLFENVDKKPRHIVVAQAADIEVLKTVKAAEQEKKIATFTFIGDREKILPLADKCGLAITRERLVHICDEPAMARQAVAMVRAGEADMPMKGLMQTGAFLRAVLDKEQGLRQGLLSELTVFERVWDGPGLQIATCCAININPTLQEKMQIIANAVKLAGTLGLDKPRVAVLCALEQVNPDMPETLDAAILSKMAERGQIEGAIIDGPFALDNAISPAQVRHKSVPGPVAGQADILLMSDIRMGNVFHKSLTYIARKRVGIAVLGAKIPLLMNSRSDFPEDKLISIALSLHILTASSGQKA